MRVRKRESPVSRPHLMSLATLVFDPNQEGTCRHVCRYPLMRCKILQYSPTSSTQSNGYLCLLLGPRDMPMGDGLRRTGLEARHSYLSRDLHGSGYLEYSQ